MRLVHHQRNLHMHPSGQTMTTSLQHHYEMVVGRGQAPQKSAFSGGSTIAIYADAVKTLARLPKPCTVQRRLIHTHRLDLFTKIHSANK